MSSITPVRALCALLLTVGAIRLATLGAYPLLDSTEGRYGEIAREMLATGNWITPQLSPGEPFWAKPPLSFWLTAACYRALGVSEFAARLSAFLLAGGGVALTYGLGARLRSRRFGLWCALILATMGLFHILAGSVMTDTALAASVTLSLTAFALALQSASKRARLAWGYAFFAGLGLSLLAKGPAGWVLTLLPVVVWATWKRQWRTVWRGLPCVSGALLTLALGVPWHVAAEWKTPGFLKYYILGEHWARFTDTGWTGDLYGHPHSATRGTIWVFMFVGTLPWVLVFGAAAVWLRRRGAALGEALRDPWTCYLGLWFLSPLALFTLAGNIMLPYVLPGLPAFAILTALAMRTVWERTAGARSPWFAGPAATGMALALVPLTFFVVALTIMPYQGTRKSQKALVERFLEMADGGADSTLIYVNKMPYSGEFYSRGAAGAVSDESRGAIMALMDDGRHNYFAIKASDLHDFPAEGLRRTTEIARFGKYVLLREEMRP